MSPLVSPGVALGLFVAVLFWFGWKPIEDGNARRRRARVERRIATAIVVLLVAGCGMWLFWPDPVPVKHAADVPFVEGNVDVDPDVAYARLAENLEPALRQVQKFRRATVSSLSGRMPVSGGSEELRRYVQLPPPSKPEDLYVSVTSMG